MRSKATDGRGWRYARLGAACATVMMMAMTPGARGDAVMRPGEWIQVDGAVEVSGLKLHAEGGFLGSCHGGSFAVFGPFEIQEGLVDRVEIQAASPRSEGRITIHLDQPSGAQVAEVFLYETGSYSDYAVLQGDAEQLAGTHRLVMRFHGRNDLCNVKAFRFLKPAQPGSPNAIHYRPEKDTRDLPTRIQAVLEANADAIQAHRTAHLTLQTAPGASVRVQQQRHAFEFGTAINRRAFVTNSPLSVADQEQYKRILKANFNSAVHENAMKWYSNERAQDQLTFTAADAMLDWTEANGLSTRGHCVYWGRDKLVQQWIKDLDDEALRAELQERAKIYMERYKGRVPEHDINNEMLHCHYFEKRLGPEIRQQMFAWCHAYDPTATLYVNDYSILSGGDTDRYIKQIDGFLKAGMKVGGIGVQGHFGGRVDGNSVRKKLDRLAQFGLPIKVTEYDANTTDDDARAEALVTLYATAFAHPAVEGIYMWGFWRKSHWRPNAAIWNADWSETSAARYYRDLVFKQWWTDRSVKADEDGMGGLRVFYGVHDVTVDGKTRRFTLGRDTGPRMILDCRAGDPAAWVLRPGEERGPEGP